MYNFHPILQLNRKWGLQAGIVEKIKYKTPKIAGVGADDAVVELNRQGKNVMIIVGQKDHVTDAFNSLLGVADRAGTNRWSEQRLDDAVREIIKYMWSTGYGERSTQNKGKTFHYL